MKVGLIIIILGVLLMFIPGGIGYAKYEMNEKEYTSIKIVECYDRFDNEIIGLECEEEVVNYPSELMGITITGFLMVFLGIFRLMYETKEGFFS